MDAKKLLNDIFDLDNQISDLRDKFEDLPNADRTAALKDFFVATSTAVGATDPLPMTLVRATDMICGLEDNAAAVLVIGMQHPNSDVRQLAGEGLLSIGEDNLKTILPAVDAALEAGSPAAEEMPFVLTMIEDPAVTEHISRFLKSDDADVVCAAMEAMAEVGDPAVIPALQALVGDKRTVAMDDGSGDTLSLGNLAGEAIELLEAQEE